MKVLPSTSQLGVCLVPIGLSLVWDLSPLRDSVFGPEDVLWSSGPSIEFRPQGAECLRTNLSEPVEYPYSVESLLSLHLRGYVVWRLNRSTNRTRVRELIDKEYIAGMTFNKKCRYETQTRHGLVKYPLKEPKYSQASPRTMYSAMSMNPSR